jgi:hypothetical protein
MTDLEANLIKRTASNIYNRFPDKGLIEVIELAIDIVKNSKMMQTLIENAKEEMIK